MATEEYELENSALEGHFKRLRELKAEGTKEAAKEAIRISEECMKILIKPQPIPDKGEDTLLLQDAVDARLDSAGKIQYWGQEGEWKIIIKNRDDKENPVLLEQVKKIQEACNKGLKSELENVVSQRALLAMTKFQVQEWILNQAGVLGLQGKREMTDVGKSWISENTDSYRKLQNWLITSPSNTNYDTRPEMLRTRELWEKVSKA